MIIDKPLPLPELDPAARELADSRGQRIGILIVAYNAAGTLGRVLGRIRPEVWNNVEEVVVFDDASQDSTYQLAVGHQTLAGMRKLKVIQNRRNLGYGGNQKAGYRYFLDKGLDLVVLLHGDGQYAPEVLAHLYHPLVTGEADAVFGSRMMPAYGGPLKGGMPLYKYAGNRILTFLENRALQMSLTEFHSGYRAYSLHALGQIDFSMMTDDFHFDTQIIIKLRHQGFRISETPIPTFYGEEICYVNGLRYARDILGSVWRYRQAAWGGRSCPEFREYFVEDPPGVSRYSSPYYLRRLAGAEQEVLDLGRPGAGDELAGRKYDRILVMDALERAAQPERLLRDCLGALKRRGQIVVWLPANRGRFTPQAAGRLLAENGYEIVWRLGTVGRARPLGFLATLWPGRFGQEQILVARPQRRPE